MKERLIAEIDAILPQTQCRRCGFSGCHPYAEAIAEGRAAINQCPPGGDAGIRKIAELLGVTPMPLNTAHGVHKSKAIALIDEQACIGCTLCILACPVDAIAGAAKQAHTVIAAECTGCELCIEPCPVDCISMQPPASKGLNLEAMAHSTTLDYPIDSENQAAADRARVRYLFKLRRLERENQEKEERLAKKLQGVGSGEGFSPAGNLRKAAVQAALGRAMTARIQESKKK